MKKELTKAQKNEVKPVENAKRCPAKHSVRRHQKVAISLHPRLRPLT